MGTGVSPKRIATGNILFSSSFLDLKTLSSIFQIESGTHLLSHAVSSIVPSAAYVLTVVFGMGTGVSHKRIGTGNFVILDD